MKKNTKMQKSSSAGDWLNTYADMVTLLLCFFVLLYSMSSIDAHKWEIIVKAFNKDAITSQEILDNTQVGLDNVDTSGDNLVTNEEDFDNLYWQLKEYIEQNNKGDVVEISKGEGFTFIVFRNNVFFDGDSYAIREEGKEILDFLAQGIAKVNKQIAEIRVLGHTTQARYNELNNVTADRFLSSNRATAVLVHIQNKNVIDPYKLISIGYGQHHPISPFDTEENSAKNRRVEILITKDNAVNITLEEVYQQITQ